MIVLYCIVLDHTSADSNKEHGPVHAGQPNFKVPSKSPLCGQIDKLDSL